MNYEYSSVLAREVFVLERTELTFPPESQVGSGGISDFKILRYI